MIESIGGVVFLVGFCAFLYYQHRRQLEAFQECLSILAKRRGGSVIDGVPDSGATGAAWANEILGESCRVYFHSTGGKAAVLSTRLEFNSRPGRFPRIEIYPQHAAHAIAKFLGMQDIEIGVQHFDDAFILKADNEQRLKQFLSLTVRQHIERVHEDIPGAVYFRAASEVLELRVDSWLTGEHIVEFHDAALGLAKALLEGSAAPTPAKPIQRSAPAVTVCPVCAKALSSGPMVKCRKCGTPHHNACWEHNGTCSVYGCTGILFDR